ncbi:hypothetical protein B0H19DRAFT_1073864 [Mycena capillaripes]|nr:hypothetical protein B0H19DRAFT_1073864 [Mycena capillaripes]
MRRNTRHRRSPLPSAAEPTFDAKLHFIPIYKSHSTFKLVNPAAYVNYQRWMVALDFKDNITLQVEMTVPSSELKKIRRKSDGGRPRNFQSDPFLQYLQKRCRCKWSRLFSSHQLWREEKRNQSLVENQQASFYEENLFAQKPFKPSDGFCAVRSEWLEWLVNHN